MAADCEDMARWRAFVDVLDELLTDRRESVADVVARTARTGGRSGTHAIYGIPPQAPRNRFWSMPGPYQHAGAHTHAAPPREPRSARRLKPSEESALRTLVSLGAPIDATFTARELRSAFRSLAQRYHPDRHPHANDAERMRLGARFAELTSAYGVLSDAV